eukprot:TRINITY_DN4366_c0_g1_i1.p1 TRINITY_DN4366_c0_g1~~TRINITY_DN4366_c0_g1_i1.p1  ORF type:complete len:76 (+),score=11.82 TRINITY_DN4366_c0_g1_i1:313-540(+)
MCTQFKVVENCKTFWWTLGRKAFIKSSPKGTSTDYELDRVAIVSCENAAEFQDTSDECRSEFGRKSCNYSSFFCY